MPPFTTVLLFLPPSRQRTRYFPFSIL
jgi:hypothetical protein